MENIRNCYEVTKNGSYFMNAAVGGIHRDVVSEIKFWSEQTALKGAIEDIRFFNLLEEARNVAANFIGVKKEDVAYSSSTSLNMNFFALMLKDKNIKKIVTPSVEFPSSSLAWFHHGYEVDLVEPREGRIWIEDLVKSSKDQDAAVVISGVQFLTGQRIDLLELSKNLEKHKIPLIINATQLIGQFPIDLSQIKYMAFTASLHKWLGADLGVSLISMPEEHRSTFSWPVAGWTSVEEPWLLLNKMPKFVKDMGVFQLGTMPFNMIAGAKKAMEVQRDIGTKNISSKVVENSNRIASIISQRGFKLVSPRKLVSDQTGICTFIYENDLDLALKKMENQKVYCNGRRGSIRVSTHFYNDQEDIDRFEKAVCLI